MSSNRRSFMSLILIINCITKCSLIRIYGKVPKEGFVNVYYS